MHFGSFIKLFFMSQVMQPFLKWRMNMFSLRGRLHTVPGRTHWFTEHAWRLLNRSYTLQDVKELVASCFLRLDVTPATTARLTSWSATIHVDVTDDVLLKTLHLPPPVVRTAITKSRKKSWKWKLFCVWLHFVFGRFSRSQREVVRWVPLF